MYKKNIACSDKFNNLTISKEIQYIHRLGKWLDEPFIFKLNINLFELMYNTC